MNKKIFEIFGSDASDSEEDRLVYSNDASSVKKGNANMVVWPTSIIQIRKLVSLANRSHFDIVPRGSGTSLVGGAVPNNSIVLDLSKMNKILNFDPENRTIVVEPGVVLDDLNSALKKYKLFFPIIPSSHKVCTIGGMLATNAVGKRGLKYGKSKDWVKLIEIVDGTGKQIPVKMVEDFIGTEGTVCIIVKAELKLAPLIEKTSMTVFKFDDISDLVEKIESLKHNKNVLSIEFINKTAAIIAEEDEKFHLFVEYENEGYGEITNQDEIDKIWKFRDGFGQIIASKGYTVTEDPKIIDEKLPKFLNWLSINKIPAFGHIGVGIIHPRFKKNSNNLIKDMFEFVLKNGCETTGEHGIGLLKREFISKEFKQKIIDLKRRYDPKDILNRGKVI